MEALSFAHSFLRWIMLILLIAVVFKSWNSWLKRKPVMVIDRKLTTWTMMVAHIQLVMGGILYAMKFSSYEKTPDGGYTDIVRFFKFEHIGMMVLAIALITIGNISSKKAKDEVVKHRRIAIYFLIALVLILVAIPWPFRDLGKAWL